MFATVPRALYTARHLRQPLFRLSGPHELMAASPFSGRRALCSGRRWQSALPSWPASGLGAAGLTLTVMPQCLHYPLASLDPLLKEIWLDKVDRSASVFRQGSLPSATVGGFYFVASIAMVVSAWRVKMGDRAGVHLVLFVFLSAAWAISLVQVRGATFPQMLSILPLSVWSLNGTR